MRTVFFDIDTQLDFLYPAGALYVPGAEHLVPLVAQLNHFAVARGLPLISTVDAHAENDPEFRSWPPHCIVGTFGQRKPEATLVSKGQTIVGKQSTDCFTNPQLPALLDELQPQRCVVYGVVTEICVLQAARGLVQRGHHVEIVADAVRELDPAAAAKMRQEFTFVSLAHILSGA